MNQKRKTIKQLFTLFFTVVLLTCSIGVENVSAFWNQDGKNEADRTDRSSARINLQLMHCNHPDTHYQNGTHRKDTTGDKVIKNFPIIPRINNDFAAGTAIYDMAKYIYEYEMSYAEGSEVDYAVVTQPYITHFSTAEAASNGIVETHNRMYWIGEYDNSISDLEDKYSPDLTQNGILEIPDGDIGWSDFKGMCSPKINNSLSQQTWATVDNMANQDVRTFVMNPDIGDDAANGQRFLYLLEGTYLNKDIQDSNHANQGVIGTPDYRGTHINAIVGLVFYRSLVFDANGGELNYA